ncbi:hypothetical protein CYLTODRAFT_353567 [Cylindrobasidium torrendii FP15055 ss-10]|uniref:S-adenosyl-L-methionine-dependent methyltransferase n=1 Tax=Cylindrobasidium torrendii FP15055 ss-10 TaxID=1314674 RepID=A0A0D7B9R9_9AGAR|nr:hypothetical protein CYLTODRAFT_353567 [Cylindrobasidium torrendii FP15055 ss-10]
MTVPTLPTSLRQSPTVHLPPIKKIDICTTEDLLECLVYLRLIYNPPVRGIRRRGSKTQPASLNEWTNDTYERTYAVRWLTSLIVRAEMGTIPDATDELVKQAASLLALCSGTAGAGVVERDFIFGPSVHVKLTDIPLENQDFASVGAQTWGGACVMAEAIVEDPSQFGMDPARQHARILELGAGTGLVGLATAKLYEHWKTPVTILATDFYPSVLANLQSNITANFPPDSQSVVSVTSCFLDWALFPEATAIKPTLQEPFDIILGADIVYEAQHATWIKACLRRLLRKSASAYFHLTIPLRSAFASESATVDTIFAPQFNDVGIRSKTTIVCDAGTGKDTELVEYAYYQIGWNLDGIESK